jgi:hypothetical protein
MTRTVGADGMAAFDLGFIYGEDIGEVDVDVEIVDQETGETEHVEVTFEPADYLDTSGAALALGCPADAAAIPHPTTGAAAPVVAVLALVLAAVGSVVVITAPRRRWV